MINELPEPIKASTFLMVCSGETYFTEILKGDMLLERMMVAMFGEVANAPKDQYEAWANELADPDQWCIDQDYGPCWFNTDVGETDRVQIFRITDTSKVS